MTDSLPPILTRRRLLALAGAGAGSIVLAACGDDEPSLSADANPIDGASSPSCVLTPDEAEGPFYTDLDLVRRDITDGRAGSPLELRITVVDADGCTAISGAEVDVWHADAEGLYSAFTEQGEDEDVDTTAESFLRGVQTTDQRGIAVFDSIYPGWYPGRTAHVHAKIHFDDRTAVTTQFYFPDDISASVYTAHAAYIDRGDKDTSNDDDGLSAELASLRMAVEPSGDGHVASITVGIDRS